MAQDELPDRVIEVVRKVARQLAAGQYEEIESMSHGIRLSAAEMAGSVLRSGHTPVDPPAELLTALEWERVGPISIPSWTVTFPIFTHEVGRSALRLRLTVRLPDSHSTILEVDEFRTS